MLPNTTGIEPKKMNSYTVLPDGEYNVAVTNVEEKMSSNNNPFVNFEFTIQDGEFKTRKVWKSVFLKGKDDKSTATCLGIYAGVLESLGLTREQRHSMTEIEQLKEALIGTCGTIDVNSSSYVNRNGQTVEKNEVLDMRNFDGLVNKPF